MDLSVGLVPPPLFWRDDLDGRRAALERAGAAGIEHLYVSDHVSFHDGSGSDGIVDITALSQLHPTMRVMVSTYLLPLRHPLPVARQLATLNKVARGRIIMAVGIGGEDRNEVALCGVDPRTRGRRTNESLAIIRRLLAGEAFDHDGEFFQLTRASIKPTVVPPIPILVGGRSDAALVRAGRLGDGWVGAWCSPRRYVEALELVASTAADAGRTDVTWVHGYQPWVGVGDDANEARAVVAAEMESFYKVPFERFERYVPYGTPAEVGAALVPYVEAGSRLMNLKVCAGTDDAVYDAVNEIASVLHAAAA